MCCALGANVLSQQKHKSIKAAVTSGVVLSCRMSITAPTIMSRHARSRYAAQNRTLPFTFNPAGPVSGF